jgi:hypothetical protein
MGAEIYRSDIRIPSDAHTISEFIRVGIQNRAKIGYPDLSYIENRDGMEYVVKNIMEDYMYEFKKYSKEIKLTDEEKYKYRYNPKKLAFDLYGSTRVYYVILLMNDMCDIHQFNLRNRKLLLLSPEQLSNFLSSIFKSDQNSIAKYNKLHENDVVYKPILPYK